MTKTGMTAKRAIIGIILCIATTNSQSETVITSYFGFTASLPDGWFVLGPNEVAKANKDETLKSLGIPEINDKATLNSIFDKVKSGNIEFYYDNKYVNKEYKNHISAQLAPPISFNSPEELKSGMEEQCKALPSELSSIFGEKIVVNHCRAGAVNNRAVLRHVYTVPSKNLIIINDQIPVNSK